MAHGYLGDGYGKYGDRDPDGGHDDRRREGRDDQRGEWRGSWRGEQQGEWRDRRYDRDDSDRGRFMFEGRERERGWDADRDWSENRGGGFFARGAGGHGGEDRYSTRERGGQDRYRSQDDHYLSWRQQQMDALDRDYRDYCRERQQQFHSDFDSWRRNRQSGSGSRQFGQMDELELTAQHNMDGTAGASTDPRNAPQSTTEPDSTATLGTTNSENSNTDFRKR
ncbi:hypothetical protein [Sphingomonas sp.]|uniref:hypothetical protein n=1 Tax=Sphingomonas sp. TaxID=28214 RepID=UPI0025E8C0EB|nr:hypothetical protein [Sphingomonas sp.]MBV9527975.1 hypothetical protein [Sphingomonas sp.]